MRALLSLLKNISNEYNNSGERSQPRESSCPRAKLRMNLIGDNGRIYTRTHRYALLSPLWLSSYTKNSFYRKKRLITITSAFKMERSDVIKQITAGDRFTTKKIKKMHFWGASNVMEHSGSFSNSLTQLRDVNCWLWMNERIVRVFTLQRVYKHSYVLSSIFIFTVDVYILSAASKANYAPYSG